MDFIERIFGISPDGGDGSTELIYVVAVVAIVALLIAGYARRRSRAARGQS